MTSSHNTDYQFGNLLRFWRERRKRSQLDLSLDAGVSQRHVSFLESGRAQPSRAMILKVADVLDIPLRERNLLLNSAGFVAAYPARPLDSEDMVSVKQALELTLQHHNPYPAVVMDRQWDILLLNTAAESLIGLLGEPDTLWQQVDPSGKRNAMRLTFSPYGMQPLIANWTNVAPLLLTRLQREIAADPSNQTIAELYEELRELTTGADPHPDHAMLTAPEPILPIELHLNGAELRIFSMISTFGTPQDVTADEVRVETFFPVDDFSRQFFALLASSTT